MPLAGIAWQAMQYVLGLQRLGYEIWYIEDHGANPYDPRADSVVMDCAYGVDYVRRMMEKYGLGDRWAYWDAINDVYHGLGRDAVHRLYRDSDALINLCGATRLRDEHLACPVRIMIDTDPVYEQMKYAAADPGARFYLKAHTHFFSYGENIGGPGWIVPLLDIPWRGTRPPVVLDEWPAQDGAPPVFTTIATWENKGKNIEFEGETYLWSKHTNFLRMIETPKRAGGAFEMAMRPPTRDIERTVRDGGWRLIDPRRVSASMKDYRAFIQGSRGEFTVAKDIYVRPLSGWFSDRSVCYLASGRPVVTMGTGFDRFYPAGEGLLAFLTLEEAVERVKQVNADYPRHARAARGIAEDFFASDAVISAMLGECGL